MKPKTHNKTKKIRGGRKQTGGFLFGIFGTPTKSDQSSETTPPNESNQPVSSEPWWKFWKSSTTNKTPTNEIVKPTIETSNPVAQEGSPTKTEEEPESKIDSDLMNGGRRRKRRQRRTKKRSKSKSKAKTT